MHLRLSDSYELTLNPTCPLPSYDDIHHTHMVLNVIMMNIIIEMSTLQVFTFHLNYASHKRFHVI